MDLSNHEGLFQVPGHAVGIEFFDPWSDWSRRCILL